MFWHPRTLDVGSVANNELQIGITGFACIGVCRNDTVNAINPLTYDSLDLCVLN